jgi:PadR family transcriptional regulator PadR
MPGAPPQLGEFEQVVILAVLRLGDNAYGVTIRREIAVCTDRDPAPGALYTTLDRLEEKGLLASQYADPSERRGGRAKRFFTVTPQGLRAVTRAQRAFRRLTRGLALPGVAHA